MLELKKIRKEYRTAANVQVALNDVDLAFRDNEFVAVLGPSGSGKTTLLNVVGGLDRFDSGDLVIEGISTKNFSERDWDAYRNNRVGFVFQSYNLIPHQSVLENVELALTLSGVGRAERRRRAAEVLERVGLGDQLDKRPSQLSGGQMQRVAIARALINDPEIVLADEPTGSLDSVTSVQVMDLLREVADDRLVIMVTHNSDLADQYATRVVTLADGCVTGDTNPFNPAAASLVTPPVPAHAAGPAHAPRKGKADKHISMSFVTALGLSARNLLTKKGRTAMTSFAGSIGIIGIAAILALSTGINGYIAKVEEDTLSNYPLTISKQSYDLSSILGGTVTTSGDNDASDASASTSAASSSSNKLQVNTTIKELFQSFKSNDMKSFKSWLESGGDGVTDDVNAIQYGYGISPIIYRESTDGGEPTKLLPNAMTDATEQGVASTVTNLSSAFVSGSECFKEMIDDPELLASQYDVVAGRWAEAADEAVLVLTRSGKVGDYTLYSIGALDIDQLNSLVNDSLLSGDEVEVPNTEIDFTYEDALGTSFKVLAASDTYRKNAETGGWTDMSGDAEYMASQVANGLDLHIVGVVKPSNPDASAALTTGVAYTHGLTEELLERASSSEVVQQQLANPDTDVFTGSSFADLQADAKKGLDFEKVVSVDENALRSAFSVDQSALSQALDASSLGLTDIDLSSIDLSGFNVDLSGVSAEMDFTQLLESAPAPSFSGVFDDLSIDADQLEEGCKLALKFIPGFFGSDEFKALKLNVIFPSKVLDAFNDYLSNNEGAKEILRELTKIGGDTFTARMKEVMTSYIESTLAPYLEQAVTQMSDQVKDQVAATVSAQVQAAAAQAMDEAASQMASKMTSAASSLTGNLADLSSALSVDESALRAAISFKMDASDLSSLISSYAKSSTLTYDHNLQTLGYCPKDTPVSVKLYPTDFAAKERVVQRIAAYNSKARAAGEESRVVSYTDYMGVLMGSITEVVNMFSIVLIAFVSISLVVSSIMIGIITYISVLERKKEIGILRAIGASRRNVASVFRAETFIEGLVAGVFAILVILVVSVPVNAYVYGAYRVPNIMSLPVHYALLLICVSVILTVAAGLLPARSAARKDPVEALRSE